MEEQKVLDESLGEVLCSECGGSGRGKSVEKIKVGTLWIPGIGSCCKKCKGTGKLDWIENAVGKRPLFVKPGIYTEIVPVEVAGIGDEIVRAMAEKMAEEIDKDIIKELIKEVVSAN